MQHSTVSPAALGRLVGLRTGGRPVLSLYLNLDPSLAPHISDRRIELDSLLREAATQARAVGDRDGAHEIMRVRRFFVDERLTVNGARGLAVFSCETDGFFEVLALPDGVTPAIHLDERAVVEPLVEMVCPERWCVLLLSSRASRIFLGSRDSLSEIQHVFDDVHRRHSQGGWSQARYQRGIQKEIDGHIRQTCELLSERYRSEPFHHLVLGCSPELRPRVERELHPDLRERVEGHFEIDVERATAEQVYGRALPAIEAQESGRECDALDRLTEGLAPDGHASVGLEETLGLLQEGRVQMLLVARGHTAPGFVCPRCGRLDVEDRLCSLDGTAMRPHKNIVERAIECALVRSVEVLVMRGHAGELEAHGSIAALLRY
jgi:peptide chain release factor subunit 1